MKALAVATTEEPYVTYARLKGTSNWTRMIRYVFRNAMLPRCDGAGAVIRHHVQRRAADRDAVLLSRASG